VQEREAKLAAFDAAIQRGLADSAAGRVRPIEDLLELADKYRAMAKSQG
jgi:antitoxin ParD1/3/4